MREKLEKIFTKSSNELLFSFLPKILKDAGYKEIKHGNSFLYAEGNIPIMLTAHTDTIFEDPPQEIYFDQEKQVFWSPQGLGADDKAGIFGILYLIEKGYKPYVLFTDGEERGGKGALEASQIIAAPPVKMIIELDRRGSKDAVFYDCICPEFEKYILDFGFEKALGSFTDISILCSKWNLPGVNLSTGYYNEHSELEYLVLADLLNTLGKVEKILQNPPQQSFEVKFKNSYFEMIDEMFDNFDSLNSEGSFEEPYCCICGEPYCELYRLPENPDCLVCRNCFEDMEEREPNPGELAYYPW